MKKRWMAFLLAFALCLSLTVPVLAAVPDADGFIIDSDGILIGYSGPGGEITVPSSVTKIGYGAFDQCKTLRSVVIPEGVTYIGIYAFRDCAALSKITFPNTLEEIDSFAFSGCISLTSVDLPDSVTALGANGNNFAGCVNLKQVTIGSGLTRIPFAAFAGCTSLVSAVIPPNVSEFSWAFPDCPSLTIYGAAGSRAQAYAAESGIPFSADFGSASTVSHFTDVPLSSPYAAAILWAVNWKLTNGKTATLFAPDETCTRGQFLTFLWRLSGSPRSNAVPFFTDPIPGVYREAVRWAYEAWLVDGSTLGANEPCTRQFAVSCLWKLAGRPAAFPAAFQDLSPGSDDFIAASWAVTGNVADKLGNSFSPGRSCTRGEALTYIYRAYNK